MCFGDSWLHTDYCPMFVSPRSSSQFSRTVTIEPSKEVLQGPCYFELQLLWRSTNLLGTCEYIYIFVYYILDICMNIWYGICICTYIHIHIIIWIIYIVVPYPVLFEESRWYGRIPRIFFGWPVIQFGEVFDKIHAFVVHLPLRKTLVFSGCEIFSGWFR